MKEVGYDICILNKGGENMGEFTKEPGGHRANDPDVGWHNEPGGGGWKCNEDPGTGWKTIFGPGTGI
ncbi:hypothetical protein CWC47_09740 [Bacillus paranthracis]|nr:hypothetical protein [Bacillus paranthracis]PCC79377.1 hypothetical protein CNQ76_11040 [Bacillus cereus]PDR77428.1 hypothetical protein CNQ81_06580 [Bacillus cereus]PDR83368.1 hypothetical protein CNQ79_06965 [Bacillus cereus]PDR89280.1 hypothetical protein CNQ77_06400 [Bacillus cereus]